MNRQPIISIIIPVYNGERSILRCLASVQKQTWTNYECILINDGSVDRSAQVIQNWINQKNDVRFKLYNQNNSGTACTRNRGINLAQGDFLAFIDQDDTVSRTYLERMIKSVDDYTDIVVEGYSRVCPDGKVLFTIQLSPGEWSPFIVTAPWAHLYRTSLIRNTGVLFLDSSIGEDIYFNIIAYDHALEHGTSHIKILTRTSDYRWIYNQNSVSNSLQKSVCQQINPLILLQQIFLDLSTDCHISENILEYFFLRYCIWYILFTIRGTTFPENIQTQKKLFHWMTKHFPNWEKNPCIFKKPHGEILKYHLAVTGWMILRKLHLSKLITRIFSRKD